MNQEQLKSSLRYGIAVLSAGFAGWVAKSGYITSEQVTSALTSETLISFLVAVGMGIWGVVARSTTNLIASTAKLHEVSAVAVSDSQLAKTVRESIKDAEDAARVVTKP